MIIRSVDVVKVGVPLSQPYVYGRGVSTCFQNFLVRVHSDDGMVGLGEGAVLGVTGDLKGTCARLEREMVPRVIGMDSLDMEAIIERVASGPSPDLWAVGGLDLALWDLNGKALGLPAYKLLGGEYNRRMLVDYSLSEDEPDGMARKTLEMMEKGGFWAFCVKIGGDKDPEKDIARVKAVREATGKDGRIRVDANTAYDAPTAIRVIRAIERYDVEFIEQPTPAGDLAALKEVAAAVDMPISVDEGLRSLSEAIVVAETGAAKIFNIKIPRCGGLYICKKIATVAQAAGITCVCGGSLALEIVRQASRHFTASTALGSRVLAHEGPGPASQPLVGNITRRVVGYDDVRRLGGYVEVSDAPGLGVEEDSESVARYAV